MVHIFHFLPASMVFEIENFFSWIFNAISSEKSCLISMPFLNCYLYIRTLEFFPPAEILIGQFKFPRASRIQGFFLLIKPFFLVTFSLGRGRGLFKLPNVSVGSQLAFGFNCNNRFP